MIKNLIQEFDHRYKAYADRVAVIDQGKEITFRQLAAKSIRLAAFLIEELQEQRNIPVAVFLPKCELAVVADMAIAYSSNAFMNLDIKLPEERIHNILLRVNPAIILSRKEYEPILSGLGTKVIYLDELEIPSQFSEVVHDLVMKRLEKQIDTDPFCIINTSGSTGTPKGVILNHRSFFDFYNWATETFHFSGNEIIGSLSPLVFDIYDFELCLLLLSGSRMVLLDAGLAVFPVRLLQTVAKYEVNFIFWVPTIMVNIANMDLLSKIDISCLKTIWFAGEVFPTKQFNYWRRHLSKATFANLYGPIEITLDCIYYIADHELSDDEPLPIGQPCNNTDILILNDKDERCAVGEVGEICVRGTSLAMGYYNNKEKTTAAFVQNPLNHSYPELIYRTGDLGYWNECGMIMFKGRKDSLIKHMGYRIELGEIEHIAVNTLKIVSNCCVVYNYSKKAITMIYENPEQVNALQIKKMLATQMPRYMVPTAFIEMDLLPRNTNGKIDRLKLSEMVNGKEK